MSFKKTFFVAALAFWAGTHYSSRFYEEVEKFEEDLDNEIVVGEGSPFTRWANNFRYHDSEKFNEIRARLLKFYQPRVDGTDYSKMPMAQSEADKLYLFAFDKGWSAASNDKHNIGKQYAKLFGPVTAEEVQSEMRGG